MFNGLIREIGRVVEFDGKELKITSALSPSIGDSIAVNGACLTVTATGRNWFKVQLSPETRSRIAVENLKQGEWVHLEPALKMGDPIDGHLIQGHIDGLGRIEEIEKIGENYRWRISLPPSLIRYCPPKGSIAVDGVSLTINRVGENWVELMIIPHTYKVTNFHRYLPGRRVNIETDMIARYLAHILDRTEARAEERSPSRLEWELFHWW